jgi:hypothetical protein
MSVFVISPAAILGVSQVPVRCPLSKLKLSNHLRLSPDAVLNLLSGERLLRASLLGQLAIVPTCHSAFGSSIPRIYECG